MTKLLFFDIETRKHAKDLRPEDEAAGWEELREGKGGISALCIYDTSTRWLYTYDDYPASVLAAASHLETGDAVIGFRSGGFDILCLEGRINRKLRLRSHYDIYAEIAAANAERGIRNVVGDLTLDAICKRNLGRGKIDHGSNAKKLMQENRFGELFNYCSDDVHLTYDLFKYICTNDGVNHINRGWLPLTVPGWIKQGMVKE